MINPEIHVIKSSVETLSNATQLYIPEIMDNNAYITKSEQYHQYLSSNLTEHTFWHTCPEKIQISLHIPAVWLQSSQDAFW